MQSALIWTCTCRHLKDATCSWAELSQYGLNVRLSPGSRYRIEEALTCQYPDAGVHAVIWCLVSQLHVGLHSYITEPGSAPELQSPQPGEPPKMGYPIKPFGPGERGRKIVISYNYPECYQQRVCTFWSCRLQRVARFLSDVRR